MHVLPHLEASLARAGLDLCAPFDVSRYNAAVPADYALPTLERASALGLLIGNTRALWDPFVTWLGEDRARIDLAHPLQTYTEEVVHTAVMGAAVVAEVRFSHGPKGRTFAAQKLAALSGLAPLTAIGLCVHPEYGPWIALRAAVVLDAPAPTVPAVAASPSCTCDAACSARLAEAMSAAGEGIAPHWERWVAVRDACTVGRQWRYGPEQLRYHYTHDRRALREAVRIAGA